MRNRRITVLALGVALVLAFGTGFGSAAGGEEAEPDARPRARCVVRARLQRGCTGGCELRRPGRRGRGRDAERDRVTAAGRVRPCRVPFGVQPAHDRAQRPRPIAIVDAYDDPNIEADLAVFDAQYGLPACTTANGCFRKVNQTGGTLYPPANTGWALEIALDVETAHAICQNCKILLVEANIGFDSRTSDAAENEAVALGRERDLELLRRAASTRARRPTTHRTSTIPASRSRASTGDSGLRRRVPGRVAVRDRRRRHDALARRRRQLRRRDRLGGQRLRLLGLRAEAGLADRHRLRAGGRSPTSRPTPTRTPARPIYDSVSYCGQTGLVPGRRHEPRLAAGRRRLRARPATRRPRPRPPTGSRRSCTTSRPARTAAARRPTSAPAAPATTGPTGLGTPNGIGAFAGGSAAGAGLLARRVAGEPDGGSGRRRDVHGRR